MLEKLTSTPDSSSLAENYLPFRGPFSRWPRLSETVLATLVFLASVFVPSNNENVDDELVFRAFSDVPAVMLVVLAIAAASLYWRRSLPLVVLATTLVMMALSTAMGYSFDFFGVPVVFYSVGRYEVNDRLSQIGGAAIGIIGLILVFEGTETLPDIGVSFVILFVCWYLGRRIRARGEYLRLLQDRAEHLEREKVFESQRAVAAERGRIARELHDVVAHQVSLMTVQAGAAKTIAGNNPSKALQAMEAVETAGRQALVELRHLLGVIRPEQETEELAPQPGLADVPQLIESFRNAGLSVLYSVHPEQQELPAGIDLTIYRVIQEALTNVIKHVGENAQADVKVVSDEQGVTVEISDNGNVKNQGEFEQSGYGLVGMRERATMLGGSLEAKPGERGGYIVRCCLPIQKDRFL